jgi:protein SCO1/2
MRHESVRRTIPALVLLAGALSAPAALALAGEPPAAAAVDDVRVPSSLDGYFPDVTLVTQDGRRVRFYSDLLRDKVVLINFIFTRCKDLCPRTTMNLRRVQEQLGDTVGRSVYLVSISVDPVNDTPAVLKAYAERAGAPIGWDFLTGEQEDIELIRRKLGVFDREEDDNPTLHTGMLVYGNEPRGKWNAINAMALPDLIVRGVRRIMDQGSVR